MATTKQQVPKAERDLAEKLFLLIWDKNADKILNAEDGEVSRKIVHESFEASRIFQEYAGKFLKTHGVASS